MSPDGRKTSRVRTGALVGFALGTLPAFVMVPEIVRRFRWAAGGGAGETALWGEPLFYAVVIAAVIAVPLAGLGAGVGWLFSKAGGADR